MGKVDISDLMEVNQILNTAGTLNFEEDKEAYIEALQKLNAINKHSHMTNMAKVSYIQQSMMGIDYYESLSPEMKYLVDNVAQAFDSYSEISEKYDKNTFKQIIVSNYEINYAQQSPLQSANIRDVRNAYTVKPTNFTFNTNNFFKYLSEIKLLTQGIEEQDIIAVIMVALSTIAMLKADMTCEIKPEGAYFLRFLYNMVGFGREEEEEKIIDEYLRSIGKEKDEEYRVDIRKTIDGLVGLNIIEIINGRIKIVEKIVI